MSAMCTRHNLGARARRAHLRLGVVALGFGLVFGFTLLEFGMAERLGWLVALPIGFGSYALLASLFGVCTFSGMRGQRFADHGSEAVADCAVRRRLMQKGMGVLLASVVLALISATVFVGSV